MDEKIELIVVLNRFDLDEACEQARKQALAAWRINDSGHSDKYEEFDRSENTVHFKFITMEHVSSMGGQEVIYFFTSWIE